LLTQLNEYKSIGVERDDLLVRNAQLSNQLEQLRQQLETEHTDKTELISKFDSLKESQNYSTNDNTLSHLNETIDKLEKSLIDKNKTIKLQQQRLYDIKKTFQRDIQNQSNRDDNTIEESPKHSIISSMISDSPNEGLNGREINFTYLRNVIFKYMISSEYEAIHLVKAISVLLNFSKDEEKLIKDTIEWKMSWFAPLVAHKPSLLNRK
jgi:golgin subfamily A protein 1